MMIEIAPDYDLLMMIILVAWILNGIINLLCGLLQTENEHRDHFGGTEIIKGAGLLLLAAWVVF